MQNKKLDKSLLPKPQHPLGWKRGQLQISTSTVNQLGNQQNTADEARTRKNSQSNHLFSNKNLQSNITPQNNQHRQSFNNSNRQSRDIRGLQQQLTPSQYSLQQKQLVTFAANQSSQRINNFRQQKLKNDGEFRIQESNIRNNNFSRERNYQSSEEKRSQSKNKEHKTQVYRHFLSQEEQFIAYSVVTKQSRSGMFLNEKLLVLHSSKRQLSYYSKLPKKLPFSSYQQIQTTFLNENRPKQTVDFDRIRRFIFVPERGSLAGVMVSYLNELGERKEWKLGMGNKEVMNEWIEMVNEVIKKEHLSIIKSQVKYPPKPKKQPQNKSNNYDTKFTKTLKQQVLPLIRQSRSPSTNKSANNSSLLTSNVKSPRNDLPTPKSGEKQYIVDKSKFVNTKNYVIDFEDVKSQDIFYEPPPNQMAPEEEFLSSVVKKQSSTQTNPVKTPVKSLLLTHDQPSQNSRFSQQLQKKQKLINNEHQNRVSTFLVKQLENKQQKYLNEQENERKPHSEVFPQSFGLCKKHSAERSSLSTHKDLNIHIDSKISFQEYEFKEDVENGELTTKNEHQRYFSSAKILSNEQSKPPSISPVSHQTPQTNQASYPRKRVYTDLVIQRDNYQNKYSHTIERINGYKSLEGNQNSPKHLLSFTEQKSSISNMRSPKIQSLLLKKEGTQIEDIIIGGKLNQGYILNFSPHSFSNNWFRLWLQTQPNNRIQIYTAFVKACKTIVSKLIDNPQQFPNCYHMTQGNTHIIFSIQNITFKLPFKLHLPHGLGQFITLMDFIRSEDFLAQVFKSKRQIEDEFENYQFILTHLIQEFNNGTLSMPIYLPMCCIIKYKGITVLCKPNISSSNLKIHKIPKSDFSNYQSQLQYIQQSCHVSFNLTNQQIPSFDLYQIYLPSFNKSIIYMDNLIKYLPLMANPLQKSNNHNLQLNKCYIHQYINTGVVEQQKDVQQIESHIKDYLVDKLAMEIDIMEDQITFVGGKNILQKGLKSEHLGMLYKKLQQQKLSTKNQYQLNQSISLLTTEIATNEYLKACEIFLMKEFAQQLTVSLTDFNQSSVKSNQSQLSSSYASNNTKTIKNLIQNYKGVSFGKRFSYEVIEMLGYLLCRNTKVWSVISNVIDEKYGINEFKSYFNSKDQITAVMKRINIEEMISSFLSKINVQAEVKSWQLNQTWQNMLISQDSILISPITKVKCLSLDLFNENFTELMRQLTVNQSNELYPKILQTLDISEQSYQNHSYLIKSPAYELLELGYERQRLLIDLCLSNCVPFSSEPPKHLTKDKHIDLYKKLSNQSQGRKSQTNDVLSFQLSLNGIKWAIKHKEFSLVEVLIQQQLQEIQIWYKPRLLKVKCKLFDLAALFYHNILGNKNNMAVQYSLKSLKLSLQNKYLFKHSQIAQKAFQSANIHFQCQDLQKSLQLYQLTQEIIYQSQKNKTLQQSDLSMEFLNIYLRKAQIKLALGKSTQSLYSCLQCLRKCEQFQDILNNNIQHYDNFTFEKLQLIQLNVFEVIFRCYQVTKNTEDIRRISKLCCSKFVQDKLLIMRTQFKGQSKSIDDSVNPHIMAKLMKMSWVSLVNQMLNKRLSENISSTSEKPFIPLPQTVKSFCLSGAFSQHIKTSSKKAYKTLEDVKEKLLALSRLYPRNRYDNQTLTSFICKEIVENSSRINNKKNTQGEYELIGGRNLRMQQLSNRMQYMIKTSIKQHEYSLSVLYQLLSEVFAELSQNEQNNKSTSRKSNRFAPSVSFSEQQRPRSRQIKRSSAERQSYVPTTTKNSMERFYQSHTQNQQLILPFALQPNQFQPELSISGKNQIDYYNDKDFGIGSRENVYSLKDQMDKKYMLVEALFGLCGREFVLGFLDETIEREKLKYYKTKDNPQSFKTTVFYD